MIRRRLWASLLGCLGVTFLLLAINLVLGNTPALGLDLQGGVSVVLAPEAGATGDDLLVIRDLIRDELENRGIGEPDVRVEGSNIVVDLPGVKDQRDALDAVDVAGIVTLRPVYQCFGASVPTPDSSVPGSTPGGSTPSTVPGSTPTGTVVVGSTPTTVPGTLVDGARIGDSRLRRRRRAGRRAVRTAALGAADHTRCAAGVGPGHHRARLVRSGLVRTERSDGDDDPGPPGRHDRAAQHRRRPVPRRSARRRR